GKMDQTRPYRLKRRAERQDETRCRITEATMALHEEIGPAATTISAIAERAGVERLTVYRHFPEESELFRACQSHFMAAHPMPDISAWATIAEPNARLRRALSELYARYDATEAMTAHLLRDAPGIPALAALLKDLPAYYLAARALLAAPFAAPTASQPELLAAIGHALDFETWRSLVRRQGLSQEQAIDLMAAFITRVASAR
ncbi:MAG TPA: helix-turn-helix domain-containing protein, partial [Ktedonobacterales bacterium]|nr:helix-turn-helix domain-containing protein [Ktedonobacterales bacterium]